MGLRNSPRIIIVLSSHLIGSGLEGWWPGFQSAVARRDPKAVAHGATFPMGWENGLIRKINTEAELINHFDTDFTAEIRGKVASLKPVRLPSGSYILTWKARGNEYSLYVKPAGSGAFVLDGLSEGPP